MTSKALEGKTSGRNGAVLDLLVEKESEKESERLKVNEGVGSRMGFPAAKQAEFDSFRARRNDRDMYLAGSIADLLIEVIAIARCDLQ